MSKVSAARCLQFKVVPDKRTLNIKLLNFKPACIKQKKLFRRIFRTAFQYCNSSTYLAARNSFTLSLCTMDSLKV